MLTVKVIRALHFRFQSKGDVQNAQIHERIEFEVIHEQQEKAGNRLVISSLLGSIGAFIWEGFLYKEGKPEKAKKVLIDCTKFNVWNFFCMKEMFFQQTKCFFNIKNCFFKP